MSDNQLTHLSAVHLAKLIRNRELSSVEVVQTHLDRLIELNPKLNSVLQVAPESAVEQAKLADASLAQGNVLGPLHGVPFTVKDVFPVVRAARMVNMEGMPARPDNDYTVDATVVNRLCASGAIPIAVTRATLWTDREERYGRVYNPYNSGYDAAGSSGGEAATIAACGSAFGIGSDSGGSLRDPANRCGLATLRPSNGRVPRGVDADGANDPRTVAGPLARSVEDVSAAMSIIGGIDPLDPTTLPIPWPDYRTVDLRGMRVVAFDNNGIVPPTLEDTETVQSVARILESAGCHVDWNKPNWCEQAYEITKVYWHYCGEKGDVGEYFEFLRRWDRMRVEMSRFMQEVDIILCPTEPLTKLTSADYPGASYTAPFSLVGWPCSVIRGATSSVGLPIGVQLCANVWRDDVALAAAACVEAAGGGWRDPEI